VRVVVSLDGKSDAESKFHINIYVFNRPSGTAIESEDTLNFAALTGVRPMIEVFPLEKVNEAYERMMTNKVRFRAVLKFN